MKLTIREAAQAVGVGKSTIHRMVKDGRLSASKGEDGVFKIDPAELGRVFGRVPWDGSRDDAGQGRDGLSHDALVERLAAAERALEREREVSRDLARRLDEEAQERRRLTALLVHQGQPEPARPSPEAQHQGQEAGRRTLLDKLFGRRGP